MGKFIVMDIVFYAGSLNYDQGSGNYQELKKITKWDGKQYTFVSRYALRYSLLETGRKLGLWNVAEGDKLQRAGTGEQTVIQPAIELLLSGELLKYPEFDFFGYLITQPKGVDQPQNFRVAPVKLNHAVSLTPFNYDALFNANIGLANRMRKVMGKMDPNPFTSEEHYTFYQYTVIVDVDNIGKLSVFLKKGEDIDLGGKNNRWKVVDIKKEENKVAISLKKGNEEKTIESSNMVEAKINEFENSLVEIKFSLKNQLGQANSKIENLVKAILNLNRSIKARNEDLSPKLLILGLYKDKPYRTYKDKIVLKDEYIEEEYDEIVEEEKEGKTIRRVIHKVTKSKKPVFEILENEKIFTPLNSKEEIWKQIEKFFFPKEEKNSNSNDNPEKSGDQKEEIYHFHEPGIEVKFLRNNEESKKGQ